MGNISRKITTEGGSDIVLSKNNNRINICLCSGGNWLDIDLTKNDALQTIQIIKETINEGE